MHLLPALNLPAEERLVAAIRSTVAGFLLSLATLSLATLSLATLSLATRSLNGRGRRIMTSAEVKSRLGKRLRGFDG